MSVKRHIPVLERLALRGFWELESGKFYTPLDGDDFLVYSVPEGGVVFPKEGAPFLATIDNVITGPFREAPEGTHVVIGEVPVCEPDVAPEAVAAAPKTPSMKLYEAAILVLTSGDWSRTERGFKHWDDIYTTLQTEANRLDAMGR